MEKTVGLTARGTDVGDPVPAISGGQPSSMYRNTVGVILVNIPYLDGLFRPTFRCVSMRTA